MQSLTLAHLNLKFCLVFRIFLELIRKLLKDYLVLRVRQKKRVHEFVCLAKEYPKKMWHFIKNEVGVIVDDGVMRMLKMARFQQTTSQNTSHLHFMYFIFQQFVGS